MFKTVALIVNRTKDHVIIKNDEELNLTVIPKHTSAKTLFPFLRDIYSQMYIDYCEVSVDNENVILSHVGGSETSGRKLTGYERKMVYSQKGGLYPRKKIIVNGKIGEKIRICTKCVIVFTYETLIFASEGFNFALETDDYSYHAIIAGVEMKLYSSSKFNFYDLVKVIDAAMKGSSSVSRMCVMMTCGMMPEVTLERIIDNGVESILIIADNYRIVIPFGIGKVSMCIHGLSYMGSLSDFARHVILISKADDIRHKLLYEGGYELGILRKAITLLKSRLPADKCNCGKCAECLQPISLGSVSRDMLKVYRLGVSPHLYEKYQIDHVLSQSGNLFCALMWIMNAQIGCNMELVKAPYAAVFLESVIALNDIVTTRIVVAELMKESTPFILEVLFGMNNGGMLIGRVICDYINESSLHLSNVLTGSKKFKDKRRLNADDQAYIKACMKASPRSMSFSIIAVLFVYPIAEWFSVDNFKEPIAVPPKLGYSNTVFIEYEYMNAHTLREKNEWYYVDLSQIRGGLHYVSTCSLLQFVSSHSGLRLITGRADGKATSYILSGHMPDYVKKVCSKEGSLYYDTKVNVICDGLPYLVTEILSNLRCVRRVENNEHCLCS